MIGFGGVRKIIIPMVGLVSGIFLFLASFSMLLNSVVYNSEFQKEVFEKLGIYGSVAKLATNLSSEISILQDQYQPIIKNNVTPDLVSTNLKSLIDGLTSYFKGNTNALPDLHLAGMNDTWSIINNSEMNAASGYDSFNTEYKQDTSFTSSPAAFKTTSTQPLASLEKINLRVLFMIFGERHITDIMLVISLFQFILSYIPIFALLLFITIFALMLQKKPLELNSWLKSTAASYILFCLAAGCLIQLILFLKLPYLLSLIDKLEPISEGVLSGYITYCTNTLSVQIILSGTILFGVVQVVTYLLGDTYQNATSISYSPSCSFKSSFTNMITVVKAPDTQFIQKTSILILALIALLGISVYVQINAASRNFSDRNLGRAISFLNGNNNYYQITNARNDQVYLLDVKVIDSITRLPVKNLGANVESNVGNGIEPIRCTTNSDGSAAFLLDKGCFKLMLDPIGPLASYLLPYWPSYEFEMTTPGKEELNVILDRQIYGLPYIKEATMQYIP